MDISRRSFLRLASLAAGYVGPLAVFAQPAKKMTREEACRDVATYLRMKFRMDVTDPSTGLDQGALKTALSEVVASGKLCGEDWYPTKARCFAYLVKNEAIDVSPLDWFPAISIWNRHDRPIRAVLGPRSGEVNARTLPKDIARDWHTGNREGRWNMWQDFDHSVPDWRAILAIGFPGMKARLQKYAKPNDPFYDGLTVAIDAVLAGIDRFIVQAKRNLLKQNPADGVSTHRLEEEIASLIRLRRGKPETAYDMLLFVWIYFMFSEHLDHIQCRSLTEIDVFITPYYDADIAAGRTTEAEFREQLKHFLWQWGSINNYWNQPVGLGGTNPDGSSAFNHVSKIVMDVMDECNLPTPKFLVKIAPNTPDWAMDRLMDLARRHRSVSFIGEEPTAKALKKWWGASDEDCRTMVVRGCYEYGLRDSVNGTGVGYINFLKIIETMLAEGTEHSSFEAFKAAYLKRLTETTVRCREIAFVFEKHLADMNPAMMMTLATEHALQTRRDGFANGCPRGNTTSILSVGTGTVVDALLAIKELVYEKRQFTVAQLGKLMADNWAGQEALRLRMLRSKRKWGTNDPEANAIGREIIKTYGAQLNGVPNSRGGVFLASGHCARQFIELGRKTGATPDGRRKGEEMSKNLSPTMGADTEGVTALVNTLGNSGTTVVDLPGDYPLDVMMHPSQCAGQAGLEAMKHIVRQFHANGGSVVQFTVFSAEELRDAQAHPARYENLQVRVCGWNVRWNDMPKSEQDKYIERAEAIQQ